MDAELWRRARQLFHEAVELPAERRADWVRERTTGETTLRGLLLALLEAHEQSGGVGTGGAFGALEDEPALAPGTRLGPWRVEREVGRGGMGAVYAALRDDGRFEQRVAIKVLRRGLDTDELVARFETERRILGSLTHPHIARLFDGGSTPGGRPYFVMEYIDGQPLGAFAETRRLSLEARLGLFLALASAVDYAHRSLVVHRDLKPANILVDADGVPKLLDFGIAKLLDPSAPGRATAAGLRPMTPDYASPEQRAGGVVTTATDVFALGLVLFELLTGRNPQSAGEWHDPPLASASLSTPTPAGLPEARRLARALRGDLDAILTKALEHDPARRYPSAAALAEDVERHRARRPVLARRLTPLYRLTRFVRRQRLATAAAVILLLAVGVVAWQAYAVARARDRAEAQRRRAQALAGFLSDVFSVSDPSRSRGETVTARELLDSGARRLSAQDEATRALAGEPRTRADLLHAIGKVYQNLGLLQPAESAFARALELRAPLLGDEAELDTAATLTQLAHLARVRGDFVRAETYYRHGLTLRETHAPQGLALLAESWNGLGLLARARGDHAAARTFLERAVELYRRAPPEARLELAESLANRAAVEIEAEGDVTRAAALLDEALAIDRADAHADDPRHARDLSNLAGVLQKRGDLAGAEARLAQAVELRRRVLGPQHPDLAVSLMNLAVVQHERGRWAESERSSREALRIQRAHLGPAHPDLGHTLSVLGDTLRERGQPAEAEAAYREALQLFAKALAPGDPTLARARHNLSLARRDQGDLAGAERLAREALRLRRAAQGDDSPAVATSLNTLGGFVRDAGRLPEAERLYRQALDIRRRKLPAGDTAIASSLIGLGGVLVRQGRAGEGTPLIEEGLALRRAKLPPEHWLVAQAESALGAGETALGHFERAGRLLERAEATLVALRGPEHADTRLVRERLQELRRRQRSAVR